MAPVLLLAIFILTLCYFYKFSKERPPNFPPGPPRLPIWGSYWLVLLSNYKFLHVAFARLANKYRTPILGLHLGPFPTVVLNDHDSVREVLTRPEFQGRVKAPLFNWRTYNKNLGIVLTDEEFWTEQRRFSLRHLREFGFGRRFPQLEGVMKEEIQDMLDLLSGRRKDEETFSNGLALAPDIFYKIIFNSMWSMIAGNRYTPEEHQVLLKFTRQSLRFQKSIDVTGDALVLTPWIRYFAPYYSGFTDFMQSTEYLLKHLEEAVVQHKDTYSEDHMRDFIDIYLSEMKKLGNTEGVHSFSEEQLRVTCVDYLFPASTTVTSTLTFAMTYLINNPKIQIKMQQELDAVVGRDRLPTLDDRAELPYNEAFLREVMRKEPIAPLAVMHRATEDCKLQGYSIPKDTVMILNLWSFQNDPNFWGDPEVFRPDRFLDENGTLLKKDYSMPFGAGKRLCVGETFSRQIMFLTVTALMQSYSVKGTPGKPLPTTQADLPGVIVTKRGMWIQFEPRA